MVDYLTVFDKRAEATSRLLCVPYAGASAAVYRQWAKLVPQACELGVLDLPGRVYMKRPPATSMEALVEELYPALLTLLDKPFILFGHSFGSAVAYELAARLQKEGRRLPDKLVASCRRAPQIPSRVPPVRGLTDAEFLQAVLQRYSAIPEAILKEKELLAMLLPILRADIVLNEEYCARLGEKLRVPVTLLYGVDDKTATLADLQEWAAVTSADFQIRAFPGGHFFIDSSLRELIDVIFGLDH